MIELFVNIENIDTLFVSNFEYFNVPVYRDSNHECRTTGRHGPNNAIYMLINFVSARSPSLDSGYMLYCFKQQSMPGLDYRTSIGTVVLSTLQQCTTPPWYTYI